MKLGIVVLDTLRYDVFHEAMPKTVDRAAHRFERMYSTSRWTVPAHASLFTGYYPTEVGTHSHNQHLTTPQPTLAEQLREAGYETVLCSDNPYVDSFFSFDRGFETLVRGPVVRGRPESATAFEWEALFSDLRDDVFKYPVAALEVLRSDAPTARTLWNGFKLARGSGSLADSADIEWLYDELAATTPDLESESDLFLFANLMSCHSPYNPPEAYRKTEPFLMDPFELVLRDEPVTDEQHRRHWDCYCGGARYLDDALERLFDLVDWDALFVVSDHGELFGEHGLRQHQYGMYEELIHVPAVALGKAVPEGVTESLTSLVDVHQTVQSLAGVEPSADARGIDLFDPDSWREAVYAESVGNYRYSPDARGLDANIPSEWGDPHYAYLTENATYRNDRDGERILDAETGERIDDDGLVTTVRRFRRERTDHTGAAADRSVSDDLEARLEHLGYR